MATVRDGDLWLRATTTSDEKQLTSNATPENRWDLEGATWSPDGQYLALLRVDETNVPDVPLVTWGKDETLIERHSYSRVGEPIPGTALYIVDVQSGEKARPDLEPDTFPYVHPVAWNSRGELLVLRMSRLMKRLDLLAVDPSNGTTRSIISEGSETFMWGLPFLHGYTDLLREEKPVVALSQDRLLWSSEREGQRRIYLYQNSGKLLRSLSPSSLVVQRLVAVDEENDRIYFTAFDPSAPNPYASALYQSSLSTGRTIHFLDLPDVLFVELSPSGRFLVLLRGSLRDPPTLELRRADDGRLLSTLWTAETAFLKRIGWVPPEHVTVTAADGETELHGLLFHPTNFDPARKYPIIEHIYGGPNATQTPWAMWRPEVWMNQWLAEQGFVVFTMDGRGTPERGKAFQDVGHGRLGQFEVAEHARALRDVASSRSYMDLKRVGIFGHSFGGYYTIRALLQEPELYKVGVASAPAADLSRMRVAVEPFMGCLPKECSEQYAAGDNTPRTSELEGKLLLIHGAQDTHVPLGETMLFIDAAISDGKQIDTMFFPNADHLSLFGDVWSHRVASYFVEHLR